MQTVKFATLVILLLVQVNPENQNIWYLAVIACHQVLEEWVAETVPKVTPNVATAGFTQ